MYRLTIFGEEKFSLTVTGDFMRYLGNRIPTKNWSNDFSKPSA